MGKMKSVENLEKSFNSSKELYLKGDLKSAKIKCEKILADYPKNVTVMHALGWVNARLGNWADAVEIISKAIILDPKNHQSYFILGNIMCHFGSWGEGVECFKMVLAIDPLHFEAACNLGNAYLEKNQLTDALQNYNYALSINARYAEAYSNKGNVLRKLDRPEEALHSYDKAIEIQPNYAQAYLNKGVTLQSINRNEEAIASYDQAISIRPDYAEALTNRGTALVALNRISESIQCYEEVIQIKPDYLDAYWNKALAHLIRGEFELGWELYESRWEYDKNSPKMRNFKEPIWTGKESLAGKSILLHAEQGLGDTIQFCRYTKLFKGIVGRVILEVQQPLVGLLKSLNGIDQILERGKPLPLFDYHCPLLSLPYVFNTRLNTIPNPSTPYISIKVAKRNEWAKRLGHKSLNRVGIVWRGNLLHKNDKNRSIVLSEFLEYLPQNFEYISLQKDIDEVDRQTLFDSSIKHYGQSLLDFSDTAALCDLMDIVISVDTSVVHLAAAMGKKTWLILPFAPDWRWLLGRVDSPWYRSLTLYRQGVDLNYEPVLQRIGRDLLNQ